MKKVIKVIILTISTIALCIVLLVAALFGYLYIRNRIDTENNRKYGGHGFQYMHGYSSTDFSGYHVYDGEKLITLDHEPEFIIEKQEDMPVLDGAEACYPLYCAFAKTIYKDIDVIEKEIANYDIKQIKWDDEMIDYIYSNGKIVSFTNSQEGYYRLVDKKVDLFVGAKPSSSITKYASEMNENIESIPIGKEAFVFFVEESNPIDNLSSEDLKKIYSGEITNWKQLGGNDQKIIAFQRPEDSGSQVVMRSFMGETKLKDAETFEMISGMGGTIKKVKQYHNEEGAIGYSFRYFLEELNQEEGVKMLAIDGVYPSIENIRNGSYPIVAQLVVSKLQSNNKENVQKMIDFMLSEDGQEIITKTGYSPIK